MLKESATSLIRCEVNLGVHKIDVNVLTPEAAGSDGVSAVDHLREEAMDVADLVV